MTEIVGYLLLAAIVVWNGYNESLCVHNSFKILYTKICKSDTDLQSYE